MSGVQGCEPGTGATGSEPLSDTAAGQTAGGGHGRRVVRGVSVRPDDGTASGLSVEAELALPEAEPPPVTIVPDGEGRWAVVVQPGSSVGELAAALGGVPEGARFEEAYGDVAVRLAYGLKR